LARSIVAQQFAAVIAGALGAAGPECLIFDGFDTDVFQYYLDHLAQEIPRLDSKRRLIVVDNVSWHKAQRVHWHHFAVHYMPGYSPDFNPIERLWLRLKASRKSRCSREAMKLARSSPWRSKSAIHSASWTSVFLPGTAFI
jgi:hypothetical protein